MAKKTREQLVAELKELDPKFPVKDDHNNADLERFIKLLNSEAENADLKEQNKNLKKETEEQSEAIEGLTETVSSLEKTKGNTNPVVTVDKKDYEVIHHITTSIGSPFGKKSFTKKEISENKKLQAFLVKQESSALKLLSNS